MESIIASGGSDSPREPNHSATQLPRFASKANTDMAIDPRWNADLPEDKALYFQSIANELDNTEFRFMPDPHTPSAVPMVGSTRNVSDHEDAKPPAGRRSSMLKSRIKTSKTPPRAVSSARQQSVTDTPLPRTPSSSSISATTSANRRPAIPLPPVPAGSRSSSSGPERQRSISMLASAAPTSHPPRIPLPPPLTMPAGFATAIPPAGNEPVDADWIGIAFVGAKGSGKSVAIRKTIKHQTARDHRRLRHNGYEIPCTEVSVDIQSTVHVRVLDVDSAALQPNNLWPKELPRVDGVIICYDASDEASFARVPELLAGYHSLSMSLIVLACKADLPQVVRPDTVADLCHPYNVGLVEVTVTTDAGKKKMRNAFSWQVKAITRTRMGDQSASSAPYRNPASPELLQSPRAPWDGNPSLRPQDTRTGPPSASSSSVSIPPSTSSSTAALLPSGDATQTEPRVPTLVSGLGHSSPSMLPPLTAVTPRAPSAPTSPTRARSTPDLMSEFQRTREWDDTTPVPKLSPSDTPTPTTSTPIISAPVSGAAPNSNIGNGPAKVKDTPSLQYATLDEILDKLLFVSVSGDDPVFIQHFFLTFRRFASPRSVLLGMQKRMRQLSQETRDPLLAKYAQMRICNLLYEWKEQYPSDFGAPGTFGAFSALLKQIISNVHLVHYGSDLLPFLEDVPTLKDADTMWAKKEDAPHLQDDDSDDGNSMFEEAYVPQARDGDDQPSRGKRGKGKASVRSGGEDSLSANDTRKASVTTSQPVTSVRSRDGLPKDGQFGEGTMTMNRLNPVKASTLRVNTKELLRVSNTILTLEAHHVAQEITRSMAVMFGAIEHRDWLRHTMCGSSSGYDKDGDTIGRMERCFNYIVCWTGAMISVHDKALTRLKIAEKLILVAKATRSLNNYHGMKAIVTGIDAMRDFNDESELSVLIMARGPWKLFQSLHVLIGSSRMGQAYRLALKHTTGPAVPDLERHTSDLARAHAGNQDFHPDLPELIHWGKFTVIGKLVSTILFYQNRCKTMPDFKDLEERPHISELVFNQIVWDYETLLDRQRILESETHESTSGSGLRRLIPSSLRT